ncbi:MAG: Omp28 family outer membrane lipoprotein [Bacteroidetes bacterium]|nr:Omp28 family outer membrane lipoprotein [Bacteroidota bacterium]
MKNLILFFAGILLTAIYSCDKVSPPYTVTNNNGPDTNAVIRKVLLEDYTGHMCVNCPTAAVTASDLKTLYGEKLIVMAVHAGSFAAPYSGAFSYDFRSPAGTEYDATFGISAIGNPNGMVNRKTVNSSIVIAPSGWGSTISEIIDLPPDASMKITNTYNSGLKKLNTEIKSQFLNSLTGLYKLCVLILEDSIVAPQQNTNPDVGAVPTITNYVHRHVLRGAINSTWGDSLTTNPTPSDLPITKSYSNFTINNVWDENHCYIIAFIYNAVTNEIVQVEEKKMK